MDINRNHLLLAGLVFLFLGLQFRTVETMVLTPEFTRFLGEQSGHRAIAAIETMESIVRQDIKVTPKTVVPPEWIGWCLLSLGGVLSLHSLSMRRPG